MSFIDPIKDIVSVLRSDGVILYPSDTVWGIGCSIFSVTASKKIYQIKNRDKSKPLLILVDSIEMLKKYISGIHPRIETLLVYHKQPLTIIYTANDRIPKHLLCGSKTIGIRVVQDEFCKSLINLLGHPITSTSANLASQPTPQGFCQIDPTITDQSDYVVQYRRQDQATSNPSVIARFDHKGNLIVLRR